MDAPVEDALLEDSAIADADSPRATDGAARESLQRRRSARRAAIGSNPRVPGDVLVARGRAEPASARREGSDREEAERVEAVPVTSRK